MTEPDGVNFKLTNIISKLTTELARLALIQTSTATTSIDLHGFITNVMPYIVRITDAVEAIAAATGSAAGGPTTTLAGLLTIIQDQTRCAPLACPPGPDDAGGCQSPFVSINQVESPDYPGRVFAQWLTSELPEGVTIGTFLIHDIDDAQIVHDSISTGWSVYVQSTGAGSCSINPDSGATIPTNKWVGIDTYQDMAFSVPIGADITVYLCDPHPPAFTECVDIISGPAAYAAFTDGVSDGTDRTLEAIAWSSIPALTCLNEIFYGTSPEHHITLDQSCSFTTGTFEDYTVRLVSGSAPILVSYVLSGTTSGFHSITAIDDTFTLPANTTHLFVTNANNDTPEGNVFTISFCPPGV